MGKTQWIEGARQFGVDLANAQEEQFETYLRELVAWNAQINLTTIIEYDEVLVKHFLDSLSLAPIVHNAKSIIDIGSGAGFPGLPLKIARPDLHVILLEATGKKVAFLNHVITTLALRDVAAIHTRAEDLGHDPEHRERYDAAVARAVAELPTLVEYALPFIRIGGIFVAQKGVQVQREIESARHALETLGGRVRETMPVNLPGLEQRLLVVIEKTGSTPARYPRRAGVPEKKPL